MRLVLSMRAWGAAIVLGALVLADGSGAAAQAANDRREPATGPVAALKRALVKGYGVRFSQVEVRMTRVGRVDLTTKSGGRVEFGAGDIVATDMTSQTDESYSSAVRRISFEGKQYVRGLSPALKGKWELYKGKGYRAALGLGRIGVLDPVILKAVLATTKTRSPAGGGTTRYEGMITLGQLAEVTPWLRSALRGVFDREDKKSKILWRLWIGKDQLVRRGWTSYTQPGPRGTDVNVHKVIDMRLTGWGGKVKIKTPPAAHVVPGRTG